MRIDGFDWNQGNRSKCEKHGVSAATVEAIFGGELMVLPDPAHSKSEERFKAIGITDQGRAVFVVHVPEVAQPNSDSTDQRPVHAPERNRTL
jgi:uncharacterized protein